MVRQQNAKIDVLHNALEDLKNELAGFKQIMAGVTRQFNENFRKSSASVRQLHDGWITHEAAIERINERCTCGTYGSSDSDADDFETVNTASSVALEEPLVLPDPVPLQVMPAFHVRQVTWARFVQPIDLSFNRCAFFRKRSRCPQVLRLQPYVAVRGLCLLIL